jgi:hypothetical protein
MLVVRLKNRSIFRKQDEVIVARSMKDMQHLDPVIGDSIEDQIISVHTPPNTDVLIARDKRIGARMVAKTLASIAKLQHECHGPERGALAWPA